MEWKHGWQSATGEIGEGLVTLEVSCLSLVVWRWRAESRTTYSAECEGAAPSEEEAKRHALLFGEMLLECARTYEEEREQRRLRTDKLAGRR